MTDSKNSGGKRKFFVIPQTKETVRSNIILAVGFVLLLAGIALSLKKIFEGSNISIIRPVVLLAFGEICFFIAIAFTKSSLCVSLGLTAVVSAVLAFLMDIGVISLSIKQMWPFSLLVFGIMLIPADFIRYGRLRTVFLFPAFMFIGLGTIFLLFSMGVVPFSFRRFISQCWPLILVFLGIGLILIFIVQKRHNKDFPYMQDDSQGEAQI
ncbi:DUF5668 domain-containing protein [uncultured Treponema sp.]|uniref:DUF5668 domain-containing protein n=1 Tax=uncultured Treponema sp. TaxID=162155 RepID=UPI002593FDEE|nr:DUF5668 domain-containing protein [uncultured Treponema sp.]